jgi:hypothetical protein
VYENGGRVVSSAQPSVKLADANAVAVSVQGEDAEELATEISPNTWGELARSCVFSFGATYAADLYLCE